MRSPFWPLTVCILDPIMQAEILILAHGKCNVLKIFRCRQIGTLKKMLKLSPRQIQKGELKLLNKPSRELCKAGTLWLLKGVSRNAWGKTKAILVQAVLQNRSSIIPISLSSPVVLPGDVVLLQRQLEVGLGPTDDVSRGLTVEELLSNERWFRGPAFLGENKSSWPTNPVSLAIISDEDPEIRAQGQTNHVTQMEEKRPLDLMMLQCSLWYKFKRAVAWLLRLVQFLKQRRCL